MFRFVVPTGNAKRWIVPCLTSLVAQTRHDWTACVVDDATTDGTARLCAQVASADPRFTILHRPKPVGALANIMLSITAQMPADDDVIVTVDGDDRLLHADVLTRVAAEYDTGAQLTYGNFSQSNGHGSWVDTYPKDVREARTYRLWRWQATHLRTFTYRLWRHLGPAELLDPETRAPWVMTWDMPMMLNMMEMCRGDQVRCIKDALYWYNAGNPASDHRKDADLQRTTGERIMAMPKHERLAW